MSVGRVCFLITFVGIIIIILFSINRVYIKRMFIVFYSNLVNSSFIS